MDVERGLIQVKKGPGTNVEVLPLTVVNLLQNVDSGAVKHNATVTLKSASPEVLEMNLGKLSLSDSIVGTQISVLVSESDIDTDVVSEEGSQSEEPIDEQSEFRNTEPEELVEKEGPQQIL